MSEFHPDEHQYAQEAERLRNLSMSEKKNKRDAAAARWKARWSKFIRTVGRTLLLLAIILPLLFAAVTGLSFYIEGDRKGGLIEKTVVDFRPCEFKVPGTDIVVSGKRSYMYRYRQFNDWRLYNATSVSEETRINIEGKQMTIIGHTEGKPSADSWIKNIDQGERYSQLLQREERYTFVIGEKRNTVVIDYNDMCK